MHDNLDDIDATFDSREFLTYLTRTTSQRFLHDTNAWLGFMQSSQKVSKIKLGWEQQPSEYEKGQRGQEVQVSRVWFMDWIRFDNNNNRVNFLSVRKHYPDDNKKKSVEESR